MVKHSWAQTENKGYARRSLSGVAPEHTLRDYLELEIDEDEGTWTFSLNALAQSVPLGIGGIDDMQRAAELMAAQHLKVLAAELEGPPSTEVPHVTTSSPDATCAVERGPTGQLQEPDAIPIMQGILELCSTQPSDPERTDFQARLAAFRSRLNALVEDSQLLEDDYAKTPDKKGA